MSLNGSPLMRLQTPFIGHSNPQHISSKHLHVIFANGDNYLQFIYLIQYFLIRLLKAIINQSIVEFNMEIQAFIFFFFL